MPFERSEILPIRLMKCTDPAEFSKENSEHDDKDM